MLKRDIAIITLLKQLFKKTGAGASKNKPRIVLRDEHPVSRKDIHPNALKVLYRLKQGGYAAYLVGGGIRDLLVGFKPKDFDVATDAKPEQVKQLFRRCFLIGKRFRLAHVHFGLDKIEVATFRANTAPNLFNKKHYLKSKLGMVMRDNVYGTIQEDAFRRDFTINALYYNIADFSLVDYCGGLEDITNKVVRLIGDPAQRYHEDPVRLLRAVRFAAKLDFTIEEKTEAPLFTMGELLQHVPPARLFDEVQKFFLFGFAAKSFALLRHYKILDYLFAQTEFCITHQPEFSHNKLINIVLNDIDSRFHAGKSVSPPFLFAALLWPPMMALYSQYRVEGIPDAGAYEKAISKVLAQQSRQITIIRRVALIVHEIWRLQYPLIHRTAHATHLLHHKRFRAAFDFLILRAQAGEPYSEVVQWWQTFQTADEAQQQEMIAQLPVIEAPSRSKPRRRRKKRR